MRIGWQTYIKRLNMKPSILNKFLLVLLLSSSTNICLAEEVKHSSIELHPVSTGTFTLSGTLAPATKAEFLFDTGASIVMINKKLFKQIRKHHKPVSKGKVAANMANGHVKIIPIYELPSFVLSNGCDVGPIEVAVVKGATRNLIGLNALSKLGRITIDIQEGNISTTECPRATLSGANIVAN